MENTKSQISDNNESTAKNKLTLKSNIVDLLEEEQQQQQQKTPQSDIVSNKKTSTANQSGKENHSLNQPSNQQQAGQQQEEFCFECNRPLAKSRHLINIAGQTNKTWHPECFKCNVCNNQLDREVSCHIYKDKIICKQDYLKLQRDKSIKCSGCKWSISSLDWVRRAGDYVYHLACFSCDICMRQLSTGEQFTLNVTQNQKDTVRLLCKLHFAIENSPSHHSGNEVTKASSSSSSSSNSLYTTTPLNQNHHRQTNPLDHNANERLSPVTIGQVSSSSSLSTYDMKQQTYPGEQHQHLSLHNNKHPSFVNYNHHGQYLDRLQPTANKSVASTSNNGQFLMIDRTSSSSNCSKNQNKNHQIDHYDRHEVDQVIQGKTHNINNSLSIVDELRQHLISSDRDLIEAGSSSGVGGRASGSAASTSSSTNGSSSGHLIGGMSQSKSKRVRTTFTEDQLSILQTHFQIDSNPDGQDLERIATITGLSKRVTQVWFQNSRARQKKYMIKRKPSNNSNSSTIVCASQNNSIQNSNINPQAGAGRGNTNSSSGGQLVTTTSDENENQQHVMESIDYIDNLRAGRQQLQNRQHDWPNEPTISGDLSFRRIDTSIKDNKRDQFGNLSSSLVDDEDDDDDDEEEEEEEEDQLNLSDEDDLNANS